MLTAQSRPLIACLNRANCSRVVALVRTCQVGEQPDFQGRRLEPLDTGQGSGEFFGPETEAIHPGIDLDPDQEARSARVFLQQLDLQRIVHHEVEPVPRNFQQLFGRKHTFEQDDWLSDPRGSERQSFFEARDRECIGLRERQRCWNEPVPVGVGFDHRHDSRSAGALPDCPQIVPQGVRVDDSPDQPVHRSTPSA